MRKTLVNGRKRKKRKKPTSLTLEEKTSKVTHKKR